MYADWLAEHGEERCATVWRVLGGGGASSREVEETTLLSVSVALWLLEQQFSRTNEHDAEGLFSVFFAAARAEIAKALRRLDKGAPIDGHDSDADDDDADDDDADDDADDDDAEDVVSPHAVRELKELRQLLHRVTAGDFENVAAQARALVPAPAFFRAVEHLARAPRSPFERDPRVADALRSPARDDDLDAEVIAMRPFCFDHVQITNSTTGVEGCMTTGPARGAWRVLISAAADLELDAGAWVEMSLEEKKDFLEVELALGEETRWQALSHFDALGELFQLLGSNEGGDVRVGGAEHRPLLDLLDELGPFVAGARDTTDFPWTMLEFERGWVSLHFVY